MTKTRYYIATRLENHAAHNELRDALDTTGRFEITYDWTAHGPVWREGVDRIREVCEREIRGVTDADVCIGLLPGGRGTHVELGIAIGAGVPLVLVSPHYHEHFSAHPETCAFYHHPEARRVLGNEPVENIVKIIEGFMEGRPRRSDPAFAAFSHRVVADELHLLSSQGGGRFAITGSYAAEEGNVTAEFGLPREAKCKAEVTIRRIE